ncbi:D-2-hydroxyacid dehydrogenase [Luteolibacter algae]|uniref:D-2-hydroxyacid dehydrogenase n=1 Tax=Luteolibacter algae TaxID=454151 RepID=A0ABW5D5Z3_9BACT
MAAHVIFSDPKLDTVALDTLKNGIGGSRLILPAKVASSVLEVGEADPAFGEAEIAFGQPLLESIYASERLRWIQVSSAGFTRYDTPEFREYARKRGLVVTNSSSVYAEACAEHVLAFMLAQSRKLPESLAKRIPNGEPEWMQLRDSCRPLRGQNVLILGFGGIAKQLLEMLAPFRMNIVAMRRHPRGDEGVKVVTSAGLECALAEADHVINILPDNGESAGFFDRKRFQQMKPGAVFYNIGRGTTVNQEELFSALKSGALAAAWLDVTTPEPLPQNHALWTLENCHITPHTAGGHRSESLTLVKHFLSNYERYSQGRELEDRVI